MSLPAIRAVRHTAFEVFYVCIPMWAMFYVVQKEGLENGNAYYFIVYRQTGGQFFEYSVEKRETAQTEY
jgi:hypothetical protein